MAYAIIESGGKKYKVEPGDVIDVELLKAEVGSTVDIGRVLMLSADDGTTVGQPTVEGARVVAEVQEHGRDKKVVVFKYKPKTRYRVKRGHRQSFTRLAIKDIVTGQGPNRRGARGS